MKQRIYTGGGCHGDTRCYPLYRAVLRILKAHCDDPISIDGILGESEELKFCYLVMRFLLRKPLTNIDMEMAKQTIKNALNTIRRKGYTISSSKMGGDILYCCSGEKIKGGAIC